MHVTMMYRLILTLLLLPLAVLSQTALPARDLLLELRQIDEGAAGYTVSTRQNEQGLTPQQVLVRNGAKATFSLGQSIPVQWVQSVSSQSTSLTVPGAQAGSNGAAVSQALTWMDSGQKISVSPRWGGGQQTVMVEVEVQASSVQQRNGSELPAQTRSLLVTTVGARPGQWVTLASTGPGVPAGVYGSETASSPRRLLQLRVSLP